MPGRPPADQRSPEGYAVCVHGRFPTGRLEKEQAQRGPVKSHRVQRLRLLDWSGQAERNARATIRPAIATPFAIPCVV
jgi:hypothetical protein